MICEQVIGRGLRRVSYAANEQEMFEPEYAEVYGVPFAFIPCAGSNKAPQPGRLPTRVRALEDRIECEISFPRLLGYRYDIIGEKLTYQFTDDCKYALSTADIPSRTENAPIVGQSSIHTLDDQRSRRPQEVAFLLAKLVLEKYFRADGTEQPEKTKTHQFDSEVQSWFFPQILQITKEWLNDCVTCKSGTFIQELLLIELAHDAADKIYTAIAGSEGSQKTLKPILRPYDTFGSTRYVDFDTTKPVYATDSTKCHISHVVADTDSWEQKMAQVLEDLPEVLCYVKNQGLGFTIPYTLSGQQKSYTPDFIAKVKDGNAEPLHLIVEVSGEARKDKAAKIAHARQFWIPAVNNHGGLGRWGIIEITDPWDAENTIRAFLSSTQTGG
jgi:type III restriction enzyme